jgi:peptide/nickel transport system substrate-binding protein
VGSGVRQAPDGQPLRFGLLVDEGSAAVAELVVGALGAVGIELTPQFVDLVSLFQNKARGNYDMAVTFFPGPSGISANSDPDYLRLVYSSRLPPSSQAVQGYANEELNELLERQLVAQDEAERMRLLAAIQEIVARDLPVLPLYYSTQFFVFRNEVFDQWYYAPGGMATGIPQPYNKQAFVTGQMTGLEIRPGE